MSPRYSQILFDNEKECTGRVLLHRFGLTLQSSIHKQLVKENQSWLTLLCVLLFGAKNKDQTACQV